ncbi:hypothetical protein ABC345_21365 [Shouchella sp. 1P09AA]|uniref:hypothetical protein n=1 Tax=unclassified Shouchella TaxID=2893065 RepID=UPI0039A1598C
MRLIDFISHQITVFGDSHATNKFKNELTEFFNERLGFYFVNETDEYSYGIRVDLIANADDGSLSQNVTVQDEIGTINENTYDSELKVNEEINVGDLYRLNSRARFWLRNLLSPSPLLQAISPCLLAATSIILNLSLTEKSFTFIMFLSSLRKKNI